MIKLHASSLQSGFRDCSFDGKFQILIFWVQEFFCPKTRRLQSKRPNSRHSCAQSLSKCQSPRVREKALAFPVCPLKKFYNCNVKAQILSCLYKFHRFLSTPLPKIQFLGPLIKIHYISLIFIHVNSGNTRFSLPLDNKSLELY